MLEVLVARIASGFMRGWRCRVGVFTNLSHDHLDMHGSAEHYLASKAQLFISLPEDGTAVLNRGDEASALLDEVIPPSVRRWTFGESMSDGVDLAPDRLRVGWDGTSAELVVSARLAQLFSGVSSLRIPAIGDIYLLNALGALLASVAAGVPAADAAAAMALLEAANLGDSYSAELATGYRWGEPKLKPHVARILAQASTEANERLEQLARRFLRA